MRREGGTSQDMREETPIEEGNDVHEDGNGSDRHRDKRQKRNDNDDPRTRSVPGSSSGPGTTDQRLYYDLKIKRSASGVGPQTHDPELYERIQRDARSGVNIGPGAGVVVKCTPHQEPRRDTSHSHGHAAGDTLTPGGRKRAGDGQVETGISATGTSSDADELPAARTKKRARVEDSSEESGSGVGESSNTAKIDKGKGRAVEGNNRSDSVDHPRQSDAVSESVPYKSSKFTPSPGEIKTRPEHIPYSRFYQERLVKKLRREFGRMGRRRLLLHFPQPTHPTRRIRTWSAPAINRLGSFGQTLASALPSCPQLTRPGRRVGLIYDGKTPVIKEERLSEEIDPKQFPLPSIEEEPEGEAGTSTRNEFERLVSGSISQQPHGEAEPEAVVEGRPRRARRQAAISGREKMREHTAPPARRGTRGPAARKTPAAPSAESRPQTREQISVEIPVTVPEVHDQEGQAESSTRPKRATTSRAKSKAPGKAPATPAPETAKATKVTKAAPKKPAAKAKTQAKGKAAPKSTAVSKAAKGGAGKKRE
ncbi:uncharacterized protein ARB_01204 [Trichophyton benhamiae CBS 112371]|uniref:Uncharacterized protein n=1 Tax=Arthroderma benhamiae (strain ATCC MYA-4681 / CBS 112371) TaxID=663331 RepID=D4AYD5_ARTBC|nr:uncharacterized protein ARB_01204 [Trichophyton benhamiae CBS 112371]EFE31951.1 hypothetical protein ARB_01204 [Trichophyton benhamiae CBS 112371]